MVHNVGLATSIGGMMFGREALEPALAEIGDRRERNRVEAVAWRRFSWLNLAGHVAVAATWIVGRSMMGGRSVSSTARTLTLVKDGLIVASLATGLSSMILGRALGARSEHDSGIATSSTGRSEDAPGTERLRRAVRALGRANLAANLGIAGVTTALSMEAGQSLPFSVLSRRLP
jgi:hypothetical protein